jgi:hypothetical protein
MNHVNINPRKLLKVLIGVSAIFMVLNMAHVGWVRVMGPTRLGGTWALFNLDNEMTNPNRYSSLLHLTASVALGLIALEKWRRRDRFAYHWAGLGVIFLGLSIDEVAGLHDLLSYRMSSLHLSGAFYYAWVIPGSVFVLLFGATYLRFVLNLGRRFGRLFTAAGFIYVLGALVLEMVGGELHQALGGRSVWYQLEVTLEEGCEMLGASLFIYALLCYLQTLMSVIRIGLSIGEPEQTEEPANISESAVAAGVARSVGV